MKLARKIQQISPSATLAISAKVKRMKAEGIDVVGFGAGEPDFDTPGYIKEAAIQSIRRGFTKYTPTSGTPELKIAICEKFKKENGLEYTPEQIIVSNGAKHSLYNLFQVLCEKGDRVLIPSPYWLSYPEMAKFADAEPVFLAGDEKNGFKIDIAALKKELKGIKAMILNSPSNPCGTTYDREEIKAIAEAAQRAGVIIISDEIYEKLIYDGLKTASPAEFYKEGTIVVNGVSKSFSMTGWRIGYLAAPREVADAVGRLQDHSTSNPASISQAAALEALTKPSDAVEKMRAAFEKRRDLMVERVSRIKGMSCVRPQGAFYVFCGIGKTGMKSAEFCDRLLEEAKVACVAGEAFGRDDYIRLSFATSEEQINKGLDRIEQWLAKR